MTTRADEREARRKAMLAGATDQVLADVVRALDVTAFGTEERQAFVWACDELEARHPEVVPVLEAWVNAEGDWRTYGAVLLEALGLEATS